MTRSRRPRALAAALLLLLAPLGGCGGPGEADAVAGPVTYNGKPVADGVLNLRSSGGASSSGPVEAGRFRIAGPLPSGDYQAYLTPLPPEPHAPGKPAPSPLPPRFRDPTTSGVVVTLRSGRNELPVAFKD